MQTKTTKTFEIDYIPYYFKLKSKNGLIENDLLVYGFIEMFYKIYKESSFYFTNKQICEILKISEQEASESIMNLQNKRLINRVKLFEEDKTLRKITLNTQKDIIEEQKPSSSGFTEEGRKKVLEDIQRFKQKMINRKRYGL